MFAKTFFKYTTTKKGQENQVNFYESYELYTPE